MNAPILPEGWQLRHVDDPPEPNFWYAERAEGEPERFQWQPTLQAEHGCFELPIRFKTEAECREWIQREVLPAVADLSWIPEDR